MADFNFNIYDVIGGSNDNPGSEFDDFDTLINTYFSLLFYAITSHGIVYSTGRNGLLAKVVLVQSRGEFVNYVQSDIGQWNYTDPKYQRLVSPEFVLYLFNNNNLLNAYLDLNKESSINCLSIKKIIEEYDIKTSLAGLGITEHLIENVDYINILYVLVMRIIEFSKEFYDSYLLDFESTSEGPILSLGNLNNYINREAVNRLVAIQKAKDNCTDKNGLSRESISQYDDPVKVVKMIDEDEYDDEDCIVISYADGKEFKIQKTFDPQRLRNKCRRRHLITEEDCDDY